MSTNTKYLLVAYDTAKPMTIPNALFKYFSKPEFDLLNDHIAVEVELNEISYLVKERRSFVIAASLDITTYIMIIDVERKYQSQKSKALTIHH